VVKSHTWSQLSDAQRNLWFVDEIEARWQRLLAAHPTLPHVTVRWCNSSQLLTAWATVADFIGNGKLAPRHECKSHHHGQQNLSDTALLRVDAEYKVLADYSPLQLQMIASVQHPNDCISGPPKRRDRMVSSPLSHEHAAARDQQKTRSRWPSTYTYSPSHPPSFGEYLQECHPNTSSISIREWMGRTGNHIHQLVNAIVYAKAAGRHVVETPGFATSTMNIPKLVRVVNSDPLPCDIFELESTKITCGLCFYERCRTTVLDRRRVYTQIIREMLTPEVDGACVAPGDDELVIHIRSGDNAAMTHGNHAQPPCSYFSQVITTGLRGKPFPVTHLVYDRQIGWQGQSPCVRELLKSPPNGTNLIDIDGPRSSFTLARDTCLIYKAHNLALTTSSFGVTLAMMSLRIGRLFHFFPGATPEFEARRFDNMEYNFSELCAAFSHVDYFMPQPLCAEDHGELVCPYTLPGPHIALKQLRCTKYVRNAK
jgi:hypothetical protein